MPQAKTVDEVTQSTAQLQPKRQAKQVMSPRQAEIVDEDDARHNDGDDGKEHATAREEPERGSCIAHVRESEQVRKLGEGGPGMVERQPGFDEELAQLVNYDDHCSHQKR